MKIEFLKEHYFFELNRKQYLENALTLPVAILTGFGSVVFTLGQAFTYSHKVLSITFVIALSLTLLSLICAFYYLVRTSVRYTYEQVASSNDLLDYYNYLREYYDSIKVPETDADAEFEYALKGNYAKASTNNKRNNDSKAGFLYKANICLVIAAICLALSSIPYFFDLRAKPKEPQRIEIINSTKR